MADRAAAGRRSPDCPEGRRNAGRSWLDGSGVARSRPDEMQRGASRPIARSARRSSRALRAGADLAAFRFAAEVDRFHFVPELRWDRCAESFKRAFRRGGRSTRRVPRASSPGHVCELRLGALQRLLCALSFRKVDDLRPAPARIERKPAFTVQGRVPGCGGGPACRRAIGSRAAPLAAIRRGVAGVRRTVRATTASHLQVVRVSPSRGRPWIAWIGARRLPD